MLDREDSPGVLDDAIVSPKPIRGLAESVRSRACGLGGGVMTETSFAAQSLIQQGRELLKFRRHAEALACFEQARSESTLPAAILGACQALLRLGRVDAAVDALDSALLNDPNLPGLNGMRAYVLFLKGRREEAWTVAERGCLERTGDPVAFFVRGTMLLERADAAAALAAFDAAIVRDPSLSAAHQGRASALAALGRSIDVLDAFAAAAEVDPCNSTIPVRLGHFLIQQSRFDLAVRAFEAALGIDPNDPNALRGHAQCLAAVGRAAAAVEAYTRLLAVEPNDPYMRGERFHLTLQCCDWRDFDESRQDIEARVRRGERADNPGSFMTYNASAADQLRCAQVFAADVGAIDAPPLVPRQSRAGGRLRIAYLSADFHEHATAHLAAGLFEAHDRTRFETFAVSFGPPDDGEIRRRLVSAFEHFEDVRHLTDRQIATWIYERDIDVAVDLKGHTLGARPGIFAHRPAPVQVSFLGYPGTLGASWMDYLVADRTVIPESERRHYSEQMIYLPGSYQVNDAARRAGARPSRRAAGLPEEGTVFCCFNNAYKITPSVFEDWMQILNEVPASVLWLLESNASASNNLREATHRHGVDAERLIFAPWLPSADHLARCALADVVLDTFPCNAHTTASDALWSGVPIITRSGSSFSSRVATSLLRAVGLERLGVHSREDYVRMAIRLGCVPSELSALKRELAVMRQRSSLFDTVGYCRRLEMAFELIVLRSRRGEAPSLVELPP